MSNKTADDYNVFLSFVGSYLIPNYSPPHWDFISVHMEIYSMSHYCEYKAKLKVKIFNDRYPYIRCYLLIRAELHYFVN